MRIYAYLSVTLRRFLYICIFVAYICLGMSICDHTRNVSLCSCLGTQASLIRALHENVNGQCFLAMNNGKDSAATPLVRIWQS